MAKLFLFSVFVFFLEHRHNPETIMQKIQQMLSIWVEKFSPNVRQTDNKEANENMFPVIEFLHTAWVWLESISDIVTV